ATLATSVFDFRAGLTAVTARTLVLSGRHDRLNPPQAGALIAALIPEARHEVIENAGHLLAIEARASYLGLIRTFLAHPP
ncbi:alpha/beta fold hydrolase, partial [Salmonella enterica]|uniref:alpha/beta fold hydrolase n=1 Tax=Salmonella enterica TaxID=28901 RepID=UPI003D2CB66C